MRRVRRIAVIGGGIGGLTAAVALHAAGFQVTVFERAARLAAAGAGLQLSPNAGRVLVHLGLGRALAACAANAGIHSFHHFRTGRVLRRIDYSDAQARFGVPHYRVHRADLQALLADALAARDPAALRLGWKLKRVVPRPDAVGLAFEDGRAAEADLLVAADGIRSAVRDALFPAGGPPRFTGYIALRGLIPMAELPEPLRTSRTIFGGGRFLIHYPIRRGELMNVSASMRTDERVEEGWRIPGRLDELRRVFAGYHDAVRALVERVPEPALFRWGVFGRAPLHRWAKGRVALLGDAAHPMLPYMAQGAGMAIEDALILARVLAACDGDAEVALRRYEAARLPRASRVAELAAAMGAMFHGEVDHYAVEADRTAGAMPGLFSYDAVTAPV